MSILGVVKQFFQPPPPPPPPPKPKPVEPPKAAAPKVKMAQDDATGPLAARGKPATQPLGRLNLGEAIGNGIGKMLDAAKYLVKAQKLEQHWPNSCVGAAQQAQWRQNDPVGYAAAAAEAAKTGRLTLPNGDAVHLDQATQDAIDARTSDPLQRSEMSVQAALMKYATNGKWTPGADEAEAFKGLNNAQIQKLSSSLGVETTNTDVAQVVSAVHNVASSLFGSGAKTTAQDVIADQVQSKLNLEGVESVSVAVEGGQQDHEVVVTKLGENRYRMANSDGSAVEGHEGDLTAEQLADAVSGNAQEVGNSRSRPSSSGGGEF